jgi:hypothetical protein
MPKKQKKQKKQKKSIKKKTSEFSSIMKYLRNPFRRKKYIGSPEQQRDYQNYLNNQNMYNRWQTDVLRYKPQTSIVPYAGPGGESFDPMRNWNSTLYKDSTTRSAHYDDDNNHSYYYV